ncbi:MAG: DUF2244 domain-containing protein [Paracoccaceae bacterium]|nr:DUF2244 domain-containing protein [Paracoccaceae bacterium]MDE2911455.1 DUF2244 domain-containing protein [Paracoccaceae bacterium]
MTTEPSEKFLSRVADEANDFAGRGRPAFQLTLWPNRSLSREGHAAVILLTALALSIPLMPFLGTATWWMLLPCPVLVLWLLCVLIERNFEDGKLTEELKIWPDLITVERIDPRRPIQRWSAQPFWTSIHLHPDGPVENYLTLRGNGREIELGAFLCPEERSELYEELGQVLNRMSASTETA